MTDRIFHSTAELPKTLSKRLEEVPCPTTRESAVRALYDELDPSQGIPACWIWQGATNSAGYGLVKWRGKAWGMHRLVYHLLVAKLEHPGKARARDGLVIDHVCEVRACCNPDHVQLITQSENTTIGARHRKEGGNDGNEADKL